MILSEQEGDPVSSMRTSILYGTPKSFPGWGLRQRFPGFTGPASPGRLSGADDGDESIPQVVSDDGQLLRNIDE